MIIDFSQFKSPRQLAEAAACALPSEAIATITDAVYAVKPSPDALATWKTLTAATRSGLGRRLFGSTPWPKSEASRAAICIGRRGLKTSGVLAFTCVYEALCVDHEKHAAPGSRVYYVIVAPRVKQAREAVIAVRSVLDQLALLGVAYELRDAAGSPEIVIKNPRSNVEKVISIFAADAVAVRGFAIAFAALDEAGFFDTAEWHTTTDRDIVRALAPAMTQFPRAKLLLVSSPGQPQGLFHDAVTKTPKGTLVVRAATWITNPRISEARCRSLAFDDAMFEQEYACTRFGYAGENFIDANAARACLDHDGTFTLNRGRTLKASAVVAVDAASTGDDAAFGVGFNVSRQIAPDKPPVRELVIEHIETWQSSRANPNTIDRIADHAAALSDERGGVPIVADNRGFADLAARLERVHGFRIIREADDADRMKAIARGGRVVVERPMGPQFQSPRWRNLRDLVLGRRLHLPANDEGEKCARQIGQLKASTLSSGWLKVEGKKDDSADVVALLAECCEVREPQAGDGSVMRWVRDALIFEPHQGLQQINGRFVQVFPDGRQAPGHITRDHPEFFMAMRESIAIGQSTHYFDEALAQLRGKQIADLNVDDHRWFIESGLGASPDHIVEATPEPARPPCWAAMKARPLPRMGEGGRGGASFGFRDDGAMAPPGDRKGR